MIPDGRRLLSGEPIHERGSYLRATLGGWFRARATGRPALLTVEHALSSDAARGPCRSPIGALPAPIIERLAWHAEGTLDRRGEGIDLCHAGTGLPFARVLASSARGALGHVGELDACIAEPFDDAAADPEIPALPWIPGLGDPVVGRPVLKFTRGAGLRQGRIVAVGERAGRFRSPHLVLIASEDEARPFAIEGDSGALVVDVVARAAVAVHQGEAVDVILSGARFARLYRALALRPLLDAFNLAPLG